jgi:hypothetical protein
MSLVDGITLIIAIGGLLLSVYNTWTQRKAANPDLEVTIDVAKTDLGRPSDKHFLTVRAYNRGEVPIIVQRSWQLLPPSNLRHVDLSKLGGSQNRELNKPLERGEEYMFRFSPEQVSKAFQEAGSRGTVMLRAIFRDHAGKQYRSRLFPFDIDTWRA